MPDKSTYNGLLKKLRVNDSIAVADEQRYQFYVAARRLGIKVSILKIDGKGLRLWRIK